MPPRTKMKKSGGGKPSAAVDTLSTDEMSKEQLEEHIVRLREELDRTREEKRYFQLERDKVHSFWEVSKRGVEGAESQLRHAHRKREEAGERHRVEITELKQKLKHVLSEHHHLTSGMKMDGGASASLVQDRHRGAELSLHQERHRLQAELREKKLHSHRWMEALKLEQQLELMDQDLQEQRRMRAMEDRFQQEIRSMMDAAYRRRREELQQLDQTMKTRVEALLQEQNRALREAEEFYSNLHVTVLKEQKELKEELAVIQQQDARADRKLSAARQENRHLNASLQEAQKKKGCEVQKEPEERAEARKKERRAGEHLDQHLREETVKNEMLLQAYEKLQQENQELLRSHTESILDVQQRNGLKELLLDRKLEAAAAALMGVARAGGQLTP
ncbi:dynein regulatory complex subunit 4-like isoform X1 [Antennarius striatus]|uniref:dynein regulatory complex subunit 4-like isoform X1 n=2 Tax=Antennarius striatus TaxID=241820 RepID=UPI0035AFC189